MGRNAGDECNKEAMTEEIIRWQVVTVEQMPALNTLTSAAPASGLGCGLSSSKVSPLASEKTSAFIGLRFRAA